MEEMVSKWLVTLLINGVYWGYNPLILTIDPNFQRDIQVDNKLNPMGFMTGQFPIVPLLLNVSLLRNQGLRWHYICGGVCT